MSGAISKSNSNNNLSSYNSSSGNTTNGSSNSSSSNNNNNNNSGSSSGSGGSSTGGNIKVVIRFRPQNTIESAKGGQAIVKFQQSIQDENASSSSTSKESGIFKAVTIDENNSPLTFTFDKVFDMTTSQQQIYESAAKSIVEDVLKGYNGTIFAYGQTSSGKTFTMEGPDIDDSKYKGIIPRIIENTFDYIASAPEHIEFTVKVSYFEIYMEKIRDLLDASKDNLQVHEDKVNGVYVKGVTEVYVANPQEVIDVMKSGKTNRAVAHTQMNADSSRSHSVFVIVISQKNLTTRTSRVGKLCLVDLAGSEKVGKTGAVGQTLEEAKKINKSLSALGNVINSLTDSKATHVPYRDSKLTRVLQESLGGNARTTMIINCSPSSYNLTETISSLRFATRAKKIKNKAVINQELSTEELRKRLEKAKAELQILRNLLALVEKELAVWRSGGSVQPANFVVIDVEKLESVPSETTNSSKTMSTFLPPEPESISRSASSYSLVNDDSKEGDDELTASNNTSSNNLTVSNNNTSETNRSSSRIDLLAKSTADGQGDVAGKVREEGVVAVVDDDDDDGDDGGLSFSGPSSQLPSGANTANNDDSRSLADTSSLYAAPGVTRLHHFSSEEREELLHREHELMDQILEKEKLISAYEIELDHLRKEVAKSSLILNENHLFQQEIASLKKKQEKAALEQQELEVIIERLNETNKQLCLDLEAEKTAHQLTNTSEDTRIAQETAERLSKLISSVKGQANEDASVKEYIATQLSVDNSPENQMEILEKALQDKLQQAKSQLTATEVQLASTESKLETTTQQLNKAIQERDAIGTRLKSVQDEVSILLNKVIHYEEQLLKTVDQTHKIEESRDSLTAQLALHREAHENQVRELRESLDLKQKEMELLINENSERKAAFEALQIEFERQKAADAAQVEKLSSQGSQVQSNLQAELDSLKSSMEAQQKEFETLKNASIALTAENKRLLLDIAGRCKKVVELEIELDNAKEDYEIILHSAGNKEQKKRLVEQEQKIKQYQRTMKDIQVVQSKLVQQNTQLSEEVAMNKKLLTTRTERVNLLQGLLADKEENLMRANQEIAGLKAIILEMQATQPEDSNNKTNNRFNSDFSRNNDISRVAKPIRGGAVRNLSSAFAQSVEAKPSKAKKFWDSADRKTPMSSPMHH